MGFAVTAGHLVFAVALLSAGSLAAATYWKVNGEIEDARRAESRRAEETAHTTLSIVGTPAHDSGAQRVDFDVKNTGATVLKISGFAYLVDGAYTNSIESGYPQVSGASGTDLLLPGETMTVRLGNVTSSPSNIAAVAENGATAYWRT